MNPISSHVGRWAVAVALVATAAAAPFPQSGNIADVIVDADGDFVPDRLDQRVEVSGVATTWPQTARADIGYVVIQDDTAGIRLLTEDPSLLAGVEPGVPVRASGILTHRRGVEELFVDRVEVGERGAAPVPRDVLVRDLLSERYTHQLVRVTGELMIANIVPGEELGATLTDRSGTIPVRIPERIREDPSLAASWAYAGEVDIVGIAGQSDREAPFDGGYRLAPRDAGDIVFVPTPPYYAIGFGALFIVLLGVTLTMWTLGRRAERRAAQFEQLASELEASRAALAEDLDDRQRLERELLQAQKMEALGRMAGGTAHDLNNMLTTVMGTAEMLLGRTQEARLTEGLSWIRDAAERAAQLSRQLLDLSRQKMTRPQVLDVEQEIRELEPIIKGMTGQHVVVEVGLPGRPCHVNMDPAQLKQMFLNLAVNAGEAMPSGGTFRIDVEAGKAAEGSVAEVRVRVSDTGEGIDPEALDHVFEPFYSTKEHGSGLGLAIVYGIVHRAGGALEVESTPECGTTFEITLPAATPPEAASLAPRAPVVAEGTGTILLAEDDEGVRSLAQHALARAGYAVVEANDGEEALRTFETTPNEFDLLVTDVLMPQMGGAELAARVARTRPEMPVVFMSGYIDDRDASNYIADHNAVFLQKPWQVADLLGAVGEAMGANRPPEIA